MIMFKGQGTLYICLLAAYTLLTLLPGLTNWDLWLPDEIRYTEVAREMADKGSYLVPVLNDRNYPEKPPLFFWLVILVSKLLGSFGPGPARWISAGALLGTVLAVYRLGFLIFDRITGLWAALILVTTVHPFWFAHLGSMDGLFVLFITVGILFFLETDRHHLPPAAGYPLAALCIGLAVLTKGPLGYLLPWIILAGSVYWKDGKQGLKRKGLYATLLLSLVPVLLWLIPAAVQGGGEYTRIILFKQNFGRAASSWAHSKPLFYYLGVLPGGLLPWIFFIPVSLWLFFQKQGKFDFEEKKAWKLPVLWFLTVFTLLSLFSGKRDKYLLPIYPAAALLVARCLIFVAQSEQKRLSRRLFFWSGGLLWTGLLIISAASLAGLLFFPESLLSGLSALFNRWDDAYSDLLVGGRRQALIGLSVLTLACAFAGTVLLRKRHLRHALVPYFFFHLGLSIYLNFCFMPALNSAQALRFFVQEVKHLLDEHDYASVALLLEDYSGGFNFYLHRNHIPLLDSLEAVKQYVLYHPPGYLIASEKSLTLLEKVLAPEYYRVDRLIQQRIYGRSTWLLALRPPASE